LDKFELTGSLKAYLATCVANRVRDLMRRKQSQAVSLEQARVVPAGLSEPSQAIACNEQLQQLSSALTKLSHEQREVIVLHIHGRMRFRVIAKSLGISVKLSHEQREVIVLHIHGRMRFRVIAKSLGISVNTVKGRYRYGINRLRSVLDSEAHE
jgi:RNA polymerase sigma-70 factor (ECF subfamily)